MTLCHARHNIMALKFFTFLDALYPMSILLFVWFYQVTGSYTMAVMMFIIQTIAQAVLEIPTGILSDKYSRVFNLRCSAFLWFACMCIEAAAGFSEYGTILLAIGATIGGAAGAMNSGTNEALIYETLADCRKQGKYSFVYSRIMFWEQIGAMCGAGIAVATSVSGGVLMLTFGIIADNYSLLTAMWGTAVLDLAVVFAYWKLFKSTNMKK